MITQKRLKELLHYNKETGIFTRKTKYKRMNIGDVAGGMNDNGYIRIYVDGRRYQAHSLAWLYVYGEWPEMIDHKNHVRNHNWIDNLRNVTHRENTLNQVLPKNNKSGVIGVYYHKKRRQWIASIRVNSKLISLLSRKDKFEVICARMSANNKYGFHCGHGRS